MKERRMGQLRRDGMEFDFWTEKGVNDWMRVLPRRWSVRRSLERKLSKAISATIDM